MKPRIGVYSGTFDPVHPGHIAFAQEAMQICQLDKVVFLPERRPRGKQNVTDILHRTALIEHAIKDMDDYSVLHVASEQFTVKATMPELRAICGDARLTFLVGSDVVRSFPYAWEGLDVLLQEASFAVGMRADDDPDKVSAIMAEMEQTHGTKIEYVCIRTPDASMTSSQVRGGAVDALRLHPAMIAYIQEHGLYR